jgi:hypothetical protein
MGAELGRISGPLLAENLIRHGIDLAFETDLLYLDVNNQRVGIQTNSAGRLLDINGKTLTTKLIVDNWFTVPDFDIHTNEIQNLLGPIYIQPAGQSLDGIIDGGVSGTISFVDDADGGGAGTITFTLTLDGGNSSPYGSVGITRAPALTTDNLKITNQLIKNLITDSDIELSPIGTGKVQFDSNRVNINGSLHATGNVTWDGNIIFGDSNNDNVDFNADINSHIIPNIDNQYDLGSLAQQWNNLYTYDVQAVTINTSNVTIDGINMLLTAGNTYYVSINGNDNNYGDHLHSTFRTVKAALNAATSGDTVVIFPGVFYEQFPLTVPQGVTVRGAGIRATAIKPTPATNNNDAFLLNGDTMIEHLSVTDFFFDNVNNKGYAFRFANGFKTNFRSPYINNITVRTVGSVTSLNDPYGYDAGDAGSGAYLDGSVADPTSSQIPTMLFYSATFITPSQDSLTCLNGVRCEWLNSFSYFARRGLYLLNGTAGRYNQGTVFGAELRSINSANVYGLYGAVADGDECLGYIMAHNFGYIGNGKDLTNDPSLTIQANEIIELNDGHMYFESTDQLGDVRVGSVFYVSQETGRIAFDAQSINILSGGNITLEGPTSSTIINEQFVQTGNIRIYDNTIASVTGDVNFLAYGGANNTYLNTNINALQSLQISNDLTLNGDIILGSDSADSVFFNSYFTQDINPGITDQYFLGSTSKRWSTLYSNLLNVDGITELTLNEITTKTTNTDLKFTANGTGRIYFPSNNVQIDNNLTTNGQFTVTTGLSTLRDVSITGTTTLTGNIGQTGNTGITGLFSNNNISITGNSSYFQVPNIRFYNNVISNQLTDQDLIFNANGTGAVKIEKIKFTNNDISNNWTGATTLNQKSIFLAPNGTGNTVVSSTKAVKLPVGSNSDKTINGVGEIRFNNSYNRYEGYAPEGLVSFNNIYSYNTTNAVFITNSTKTTVAIGTLSVTAGQNVVQVVSTAGLSIGYKVVSGPGLVAGSTITNIAGSLITLDTPAATNATGLVTFGPVVLNFTYISGLQVGQAVTATNIQPGTVISAWTTNSVTLSKPISGNVLTGSSITFGSVSSTFITPELTPGAADNIIRFGIAGSVVSTLDNTKFYSNSWNIGNIDVTGANIQKLNSSDLTLVPDTGYTNINNITINDVYFNNLSSGAITLATTGQGYVKFAGVNAVVFPAGDNSQRRLTPELGETRYNTELEYLEVFDNSNWIPAIGSSGAASQTQIEEIMNLWAVILG